jgi:hypothetical protein
MPKALASALTVRAPSFSIAMGLSAAKKLWAAIPAVGMLPSPCATPLTRRSPVLTMWIELPARTPVKAIMPHASRPLVVAKTSPLL